MKKKVNAALRPFRCSPYGRVRGFTLIEMSIVLVVIGLLVGGVLVGRDLIVAAGARAQISQIEKYQAAVNTFKGKYNNQLPGDMNAIDAAQFGFAARSGSQGSGDGNGIIEGAGGSNYSGTITGGETMYFWEDLSQAGLIEGHFRNTYSSKASDYYPASKLGNSMYVYVWSSDISPPGSSVYYNESQIGENKNYFAVAQLNGQSWSYPSTPGIPVKQAYMIDAKIDDGLPQSGNVRAIFASTDSNGSGIFWPEMTQWGWPTEVTISNYYAGYTTATSPSTVFCFDNGGQAGTVMTYSVNFQNGSNAACALSFKFQ